MAGAVFDVAVDLRAQSPAFGQWCGAQLDAETHAAMWIPPGFAHGYYVLSERATVHPRPRPQKLDAYKPVIQERLSTYPRLSAVRLLAECRAAGYAGGVTQLRDYVAQIRPRPEPGPVIRFETDPGHHYGKRRVMLSI